MFKKTIIKIITLMLVFAMFLSLSSFANNYNEIEKCVNDDKFEVIFNSADSISFNSQTYNLFDKVHFYFKTKEITSIKSQDELNNAYLEMVSWYENLDDQIVEMTVQFKCDFFESREYILFSAERDDLKTIEEVHNFRQRLNSFSKEYHNNVINSNIDTLSFIDYEKAVPINYSPFVKVLVNLENISIENINLLMEHQNVVSVSFSPKHEFVSNVSWNNTLNSIGAYDVVNNGTYTGEDVRIGIFEAKYEGIIEALCDTNHINLLDKNIVLQFDDAVDPDVFSQHGTAVASIAALMAPDAEFYVGCVDHDGYEGLEWFLDNWCDVINCSFCIQSTQYINGHYIPINLGYREDIDKVYDYQILAHFVNVVVSSGNRNTDDTHHSYNPYGQINSPGLAYNAVTVGGLNKTILFGYLEHNADSCYVSAVPYVKPEISSIFTVNIPNVGIKSGTSFSAPQVTASIALLGDKNVTYLTYPEKTKAILLAAAEKTHDYTEDRGQFDDKVGAGCLRLDNALTNSDNTRNFLVYYGTSAGACVYYEDVYLTAGETINIALAWKIYNQNPSLGNNYYLTDYDLRLFDSSGTQVSSSQTRFSNTELIRYQIETSGTYRMAVHLYNDMLIYDLIGDSVSLSFNHQ